jgi:hypothetical protein
MAGSRVGAAGLLRLMFGTACGSRIVGHNAAIAVGGLWIYAVGPLAGGLVTGVAMWHPIGLAYCTRMRRPVIRSGTILT